MEARLVKDIQPRFNVDLKDDKTFPYLQIRVREEFPRVEFTRQPRRKGVRLYGPFTSAKSLRFALNVLQRIFKFRTCALDIKESDPRWRWFRPCIRTVFSAARRRAISASPRKSIGSRSARSGSC